MFLSILTFDFDLMLGSFLTFGRLNGLLLGLRLVGLANGGLSIFVDRFWFTDSQTTKQHLLPGDGTQTWVNQGAQ